MMKTKTSSEPKPEPVARVCRDCGERDRDGGSGMMLNVSLTEDEQSYNHIDQRECIRILRGDLDNMTAAVNGLAEELVAIRRSKR